MFDRVIVSCDEQFKDFWLIVAKAWKKYFPDKKISLAFVTNRKDDDELVTKMREHGDVRLFPVIEGIPTANLAKMARHILAGFYGNEICMIEDIDTIPLQSEFVINKTSMRENGKLLFIGRELYKNGTDVGKFPISNITGESYLFRKVVNPNNLEIDELFKSWVNTRVFDHKEAINNTPDLSGQNGFSDESLWRVMLHRSGLSDDNFCFIERGVNPQIDWIDRSWWSINVDKLRKNEYVICNFLRPYVENFEKIKPIASYIFEIDESQIKKSDTYLV